MSHQEFENYLALLTRLLKVAPSQREQLAQEFRAHLEDRLDELLAGGMAKDKAVQLAIGEFGDAAVLAAELAQVAHRKRRRFIMRMSLAGVAALAAVGLLVFALWPDGRQVQGPPAAVAQAEGAAAAAAAPAPQNESATDNESQATKQIQVALDKQAQFDFIDTPLKEVAEFLADTYKINVVLAKKALSDAGATEDTPVTSSIRGISLRSALRIMLRELNLNYVIRDEVLRITTNDDAESLLINRVYDCRELLALPTPPGSARPRSVAGGGGFFAVQDDAARKPGAAPGSEPGIANPAGPATPAPAGGSGAEGGPMGGAGHSEGKQPREPSDAENLMRVITTTVEPDSWDEEGGPGTIAEYKGLVVISQTVAVHEKVERLLNMLHESAGLKEKRVKVVE